MDRRMERRDFLSLTASSLAAFVAACSSPPDGASEVIEGPEGRVLQWEKDELIVLVNGAKRHYAPGETVKLTIVVNNQATEPVEARLRTKLIGRGMQAVAEAQVSRVSIAPEGATTIEKELLLPQDLSDGDYALQVELPPWEINGRQRGGGKISQPVRVGASPRGDRDEVRPG